MFTLETDARSNVNTYTRSRLLLLNQFAPMIEVLHHQASMPSIGGSFYTNTPQDPYQYRQPLTQLHNQAPAAREGLARVADWVDNTKRTPYNPGFKSQASNNWTPPPSVSNGPSANSMLAPTYGGLYKANVHTNGASRQPSRPPSPSREVSPKHVEAVHAASAYAAETTSHESDQIAPYLQIPATINSSKGSLSEFAAQVCIPSSKGTSLTNSIDHLPILV